MEINNINQQSISSMKHQKTPKSKTAELTDQTEAAGIEPEVSKSKGKGYGQVTASSLLERAGITLSESTSEEAAAVYDKSSDTDTKMPGWVQEGIEQMKAQQEENELRMVELFRETVKGGALKQVGGLKGYITGIQDALNAEKYANETDEEKLARIGEALGIEFELTEEGIAKAQADVAEDGYWGAEQTSQRFLEFAVGLSGGDPEKADMLMEAVEAGFKAAEELWGSELPQLSYDTLEMTREKFAAWRDGTEDQGTTEL